MKTPRFWYPQPEDRVSALVAGALSPLSLFFKAGTRLRRSLATPYHSRKPIICVGNVVAGGSGKTPVALEIANLLKGLGHNPAFVSRGYGGTGVLTCVDLQKHGADAVGDEALLLAETAPTWTAKNRFYAVREAERHCSIIVMDDGMQNPNIDPAASILVIDGDVGIGNGRLIPAGPLREPLDEALKRTTAVVLMGADRQKIASRVEVPVFRAHLEPQLQQGFPRLGRFVAFAGIGRPEKFFATAQGLGLDIASARQYPDHYAYTQADIDALRLEAEVLGARLLTTEKDAVRLPADFRSEVIVLPVRLVFDDAGAETALGDLLLSPPRGRS